MSPIFANSGGSKVELTPHGISNVYANVDGDKELIWVGEVNFEPYPGEIPGGIATWDGTIFTTRRRTGSGSSTLTSNIEAHDFYGNRKTASDITLPNNEKSRISFI